MELNSEKINALFGIVEIILDLAVEVICAIFPFIEE